MDLRVAKQCSPAFRFYGIWACDQDQLNTTKRGKHAQIGTLPNQSPMTFLVMQLWFWGWTRRPLGRHAISAKGPQFVGDGDSVGWNLWGEKLTPRICLIFFWGGFLNCRGLFFDSELDHSHIEELLWWKLCAQKERPSTWMVFVLSSPRARRIVTFFASKVISRKDFKNWPQSVPIFAFVPSHSALMSIPRGEYGNSCFASIAGRIHLECYD